MRWCFVFPCAYILSRYTPKVKKNFHFFIHQNIQIKGGHGFWEMCNLHKPKNPGPGNNVFRNDFSKIIYSHFSIFLKIDFSRPLCYNIYIGDNYIINYLVLHITLQGEITKMAANRLKLDFSIQTTNGRRDFVSQYVVQPQF